jgi:hypothetical protein
MKRILSVLVLLLCIETSTTGQFLKANFGIDGDLRANYFDSKLENGNDDWFRNNAGTGQFIIDTTGASYILSRYAVDPAFRRIPFFRGMRYPQFTILNNRMLIDGIFIRDYHGDDSTVFAAGASKNGMSPADWTCPVSQGIPDKNEILDIMMHVRREGPNVGDSLWMFGGVSIENTTGDRYFDFEMYQTDIYYDRSALRFFGYGPQAGHTAWVFDAAGNVVTPGDVIFTAEFGTAGLTLVEARIWINQASMAITPVNFNWGGEFDGASSGATYGYANIAPKTTGVFYLGTVSANNTWAGPFNVVRTDNTVSANYSAKQFMEFGVNLSKLGLDPLLTIGDACSMPFRRILVKSRSSNSFTAALKDFVGPFDFFRAPRVQAAADIPLYCGTNGVSTISVNNPLLTSLYTWHTPNGNIVSDTIGPSITVNAPGMYIVSQQLMDSCGTTYAMDTVNIILDTTCTLLRSAIRDFKANAAGRLTQLNWSVSGNSGTAHYEIERSTDALSFSTIGKLWPGASLNYNYSDDANSAGADVVYYRVKIVDVNGNVQYSKILAVQVTGLIKAGFKLMPNPVRTEAQLLLTATQNTKATISIHGVSGATLRTADVYLQKGSALIDLENFNSWQRGVYIIKVAMEDKIFTQKMILVK